MKTKAWIRAMVAVASVATAGNGCGETPASRETRDTPSAALSITSDVLPPATSSAPRSVTATASNKGPLLRWADPSGTHWRRLAPDGSWLDASELSFPSNVVDLVATEDGYTAVVTETPDTGVTVNVSVLPLSEMGAVAGSPVAIGSSSIQFNRVFSGGRIVASDNVPFVLWTEEVLNLFTHAGTAGFAGSQFHGVRIRSGVAEQMLLAAHDDEHGTVVAGLDRFAVLWSSTGWQHFPPPGVPIAYANRWYPTEWAGAIVLADDSTTSTTAVALPPAPVEPNPWPFGSAVRYNDQLHALASDGTSFLLLWIENQQILGQLRDAGLLAAGQPFVVSDAQAAPTGESLAVVFADGAYLVVWADARPGTAGHDLFAARVAPAGGAVDASAFPIVGGPGWKKVTSLVPSGEHCALLTYDNGLTAASGQTFNAGNARLVCPSAAPVRQPTSLQYIGPLAGSFDRLATLKARLISGTSAVPGATLTFTLGTQTCAAVTDADGDAACALIPGALGPLPLSVVFAGSPVLTESFTSTTFTASREVAYLSFEHGPWVLLTWAPLPLAARLSADVAGTIPLPGQPLVFEMDVADQTAACTATTDETGLARCLLPSSAFRRGGPGSVSVSFSGDATHDPQDASIPIWALRTPPWRPWWGPHH